MGFRRQCLPLIAMGALLLFPIPTPAASGEASGTFQPFQRRFHWHRLRHGDTEIRQLDPRLRRSGDGQLAEAIVEPPSLRTLYLLDYYGLPAIPGVPPVAYLEGQKGKRHFLRGNKFHTR